MEDGARALDIGRSKDVIGEHMVDIGTEMIHGVDLGCKLGPCFGSPAEMRRFQIADEKPESRGLEKFRIELMGAEYLAHFLQGFVRVGCPDEAVDHVRTVCGL